MVGGSGCIGAPSVNKSDDVSGKFAGNCVWIIEQVSIARVNVDCVIVVHGKSNTLNLSPVNRACFLPARKLLFINKKINLKKV